VESEMKIRWIETGLWLWSIEDGSTCTWVEDRDQAPSFKPETLDLAILKPRTGRTIEGVPAPSTERASTR